jgi:flavin reductase (DIM6/NTAB) family NADH-FMN oxidoreductase RutF
MVALPDLKGDPGERLMAIGEVVGIYINDSALTNGLFDMVKAGSLARCGYWDYQVTTDLFDMPKPDFKGSH